MGPDTPDDARLRPHPEARFAPSQVELDLNAVAARLRAEPQTASGGPRRWTLYKDGELTIALFLFEKSTGLREHRADGTVNMHVLRGRFQMTADGQVHHLQAGQMLILSPGISHALTAEVDSELLVTIRLVGQ